MAMPTSSGDVFEMAMGMETVGKDFYEALAEASDDVQVRQFCTLAARDEAKHYGIFKQMRDQWLQTTKTASPGAETAGALTVLAKGRIQPDPADVRKVAIGGNLADALKMATHMEADAIEFYGEMANCLPDAAKSIQAIIVEETRHLSSLRVMAL
jgi:rubrerythrin